MLVLEIHAVSLGMGAVVEGIHAVSIAQEKVESGEISDGYDFVDGAPQSLDGIAYQLEVLQQQRKIDFTVVVALEAVPESRQEMPPQTFGGTVPVVAERPAARHERVSID
jgi:hypothetical protein